MCGVGTVILLAHSFSQSELQKSKTVSMLTIYCSLQWFLSNFFKSIKSLVCKPFFINWIQIIEFLDVYNLDCQCIICLRLLFFKKHYHTSTGGFVIFSPLCFCPIRREHFHLQYLAKNCFLKILTNSKPVDNLLR